MRDKDTSSPENVSATGSPVVPEGRNLDPARKKRVSFRDLAQIDTSLLALNPSQRSLIKAIKSMIETIPEDEVITSRSLSRIMGRSTNINNLKQTILNQYEAALHGQQPNYRHRQVLSFSDLVETPTSLLKKIYITSKEKDLLNTISLMPEGTRINAQSLSRITGIKPNTLTKHRVNLERKILAARGEQQSVIQSQLDRLGEIPVSRLQMTNFTDKEMELIEEIQLMRTQKRSVTIQSVADSLRLQPLAIKFRLISIGKKAPDILGDSPQSPENKAFER